MCVWMCLYEWSSMTISSYYDFVNIGERFKYNYVSFILIYNVYVNQLYITFILNNYPFSLLQKNTSFVLLVRQIIWVSNKRADFRKFII